MAELSPMMRQYMEIKEQNKDSILFFRLGDFYEMFFEDARLASEELSLTLTGKDCGLEERAPMCGVPYHSCESYIARLVAAGHKVAICEQTEDPAKAKGLVKRDVIRVITPGTVVEGDMLDEGRNNYLAAVYEKDGSIGLVFADASTGQCHATEVSGDNAAIRACDEISRFSPTEIIYPEDFKEESIKQFINSLQSTAKTERDKVCFDKAVQGELVCRNFGVKAINELGFTADSCISAAVCALTDYLTENGKGAKVTVNKLSVYTQSQFMRLDSTAIRNLELCQTMRSGSKRGTLLWVLDKTRTAMGRRLLSSYITEPLLSVNDILARQNAVEELCELPMLRQEAQEYLTGIRDIERIITKVIYGTANARDLLSLAETAHKFPYIKQLLATTNCRMIKQIYADIDTADEIVKLIDDSINPDAPFLLREGNIIKEGYSEEIDTLRRDMQSGTTYLADIEARERERSGIKNLRVRFNKVFGYYIEVTNSFLDKVPEDYIRKQTLTNCERFITEELKQLETRVLTAKDKALALEQEMFSAIREKVSAYGESFKRTAGAIARLDVMCSFAQTATENDYCRPVVNTSGVISIKDGRHPVVEQMINSPFVQNDTLLDMNDNRCAIITGPNMAGKSTYMRQVALITIMAQIGSFVPAKMAQIGIVDGVYTRVGASDDLASGKSTFMVEMSEVADILKSATKHSLLILDEIGRGTSTFDGMAIARAVLEYVADKKTLGAKALFATHYHELTAMENEISGVKNYNIAAKKRGDDIIFLRRIVPGGADESYGIEVAKLGGIPKAVTDRAKQILKKILSEGVVTYKTVAASDSQLPLEMQGAVDILSTLKNLDVNTLTPIEAMSVLFDIVNKAKSI